MRLLDDLRAEHVLIERVVGALRTFVARRVVDPSAPNAEGDAFIRFFRLYAHRFHHAREEDVLLRVLVERTEAPAERGPVRIIRDDHRAMTGMVDEMASLIAKALSDVEARRLVDVATRFGTALLRHIDAENSVLFPESEARLRRCVVLDLPDRGPDAEEAAARDEGERLCERYTPSEFPDLLRGDGCVSCPAYGDRCDGVEQEWSHELEWEDMRDRIG